jgi:hypothetical protein
LPASSEPARRTKAREIDTWSTTSSGMLARARVGLRRRLAEGFRVAAQGVHGRGTFERAARRARWGLNVIRDGSRWSRCRLGRACGLRVRQAAGVGGRCRSCALLPGAVSRWADGGKERGDGIDRAGKHTSEAQANRRARSRRLRYFGTEGQGACARRRRCGFVEVDQGKDEDKVHARDDDDAVLRSGKT